jgi:N-methylhydantoinase B
MVKRGDLFTILTPGAGGYGNPFWRDAEQVADDVRKGFITMAAAVRRYGVALTADGTVDAAKTAALRADAPEADTVDPARDAWDEIFPDADVTALNRRLYDLPPGPANHRRSRIFARVLGDLDAGQIAATSRAERTTRRALFSDLVSAEVARK